MLCGRIMCSQGSSAATPQTRNSGAGKLSQLRETQESGGRVSPAGERTLEEGALASARTGRGQCGPHPRGASPGAGRAGPSRVQQALALLQVRGGCWSLAQRSWGKRAFRPLVLEEEGEALLFSPLEIRGDPGPHQHVCWLLRAS